MTCVKNDWPGPAIDWDNNIWVYRELYVKHLTAEQLADRILETEENFTKLSEILAKKARNGSKIE